MKKLLPLLRPPTQYRTLIMSAIIFCGAIVASAATAAGTSHWVYPVQHAKVAIVFIHGLTGDSIDTWTLNKGKGQSFFRYTRDDPKIGKYVDIFTFAYTSEYFERGSLHVDEAAAKLFETLKNYNILDYENIVFVAHSMGGANCSSRNDNVSAVIRKDTTDFALRDSARRYGIGAYYGAFFAKY
ncbi:alpha/beta hydrolase [Paraburkholderia sp. SIMBA_050]